MQIKEPEPTMGSGSFACGQEKIKNNRPLRAIHLIF
jgi:hypothetical protein